MYDILLIFFWTYSTNVATISLQGFLTS